MNPDELELLLLTVPPLQLYAGPDGNYPLELQALMRLRLGEMPTMAALRYWLPKLYAAEISEEARFRRWELLVDATMARTCHPPCWACTGLRNNMRDKTVWETYPTGRENHYDIVLCVGAAYSQLWDARCIYGATTVQDTAKALLSLQYPNTDAFSSLIYKVLKVRS